MLKHFYSILLLSLFFSVQSFSQTKPLGFEEEFDAFRKNIGTKHQLFIDTNDSIFISFLKKSWKSIRLLPGVSNSVTKPKVQPRLPKDSINKSIDQINVDSYIDTTIYPEPSKDTVASLIQDIPVAFDALTIRKAFNFFGNEEAMDVSPTLTPRFKSVSPDGITVFYAALAKNAGYWMQSISFLQKLRTKYQLNDWGFYQLVKSAAASIYEESNDQRLFVWYVLLKTGYKAKLGYDNNRVYLLIATRTKIYNVPYFIETGDAYYLVDQNGGKVEGLKTHEFNYPASTAFVSLALETYPQLNGTKKKRSVKYRGTETDFEFDVNLLNFLSSYPHHELSQYFLPGLSSKNISILDALLKPHMKGLTKREIIDVLLDFSQKFTDYATDQDQFGKERYLFAEESLFYPFNDCEDRTILLAALVERYTGLKSVALDFPGHVNLAVNIPGETIGSFVNFKGERFLICDPTYMNAKSGMLAQQYRSEKVKVISF